MKTKPNRKNPGHSISKPKGAPSSAIPSESGIEKHPLLALSRMTLLMAPDEDSAIVEADDR